VWLEVLRILAERVGFEPTLPFRVNTLSKRAPSATRPSLRDHASDNIQSMWHAVEPQHLGLTQKRSLACLQPMQTAGSLIGSKSGAASGKTDPLRNYLLHKKNAAAAQLFPFPHLADRPTRFLSASSRSAKKTTNCFPCIDFGAIMLALELLWRWMFTLQQLR
jgi:hypothetical protein